MFFFAKDLAEEMSEPDSDLNGKDMTGKIRILKGVQVGLELLIHSKMAVSYYVVQLVTLKRSN